MRMKRTLAMLALPLWYGFVVGAFLGLVIVCLAADWTGISDQINEELTETP